MRGPARPPPSRLPVGGRPFPHPVRTSPAPPGARTEPRRGAPRSPRSPRTGRSERDVRRVTEEAEVVQRRARPALGPYEHHTEPQSARRPPARLPPHPHALYSHHRTHRHPGPHDHRSPPTSTTPDDPEAPQTPDAPGAPDVLAAVQTSHHPAPEPHHPGITRMTRLVIPLRPRTTDPPLTPRHATRLGAAQVRTDEEGEGGGLGVPETGQRRGGAVRAPTVSHEHVARGAREATPSGASRKRRLRGTGRAVQRTFSSC